MAMMKKLTSALVASSLVLGLVGTASATTPDKVQAAAERMAALGLVQGKGGPDLALGDSITRAELVTVIVRAFGQESNSRLLKGVAAFPDTADHWASGYIAMATKLIAERTNGTEVVGMPDGTFKPDQPVTAGEAVAFLMKFVGAPRDNSLPWPDNYLQGALNAGIITAEDLANLQGVKNAPATRGLAFYLADSAFYGYKLAEGSTVYRTFVDTVGPDLNITTQVTGPTLAKKITVTGTVANAESVFVGSPENQVPIVGGTFSVDVDLALGENDIVVTAVDLVGNTTQQVLKVTRTTGPAVGIAAEDVTVAAGETVDVAAAVVDEVGNALEGYTITGESEVGTFADGKFTAGTKAGEGKLVLKAGENGEFTKEVKVTVVPAQLAAVKAANPFAPGKAVKLIGVDAYGNVIDGVTFAEAVDSPDAYIEGDRLIVTKEGSYEISGTKDDVTVTSTVSAYGDLTDLLVEADKDSLVANGESKVTVTVKAIDGNGNFVPDFNGYVRYEGDLTVDNDDDVVVNGDHAIAEVKDGVATFVFVADDLNLAGEDADLEFSIYEDFEDADAAASKARIAEADFSIKVEEQKATSIALDAPEYLPVNLDNYTTEVEVIVLDQEGKEMLEADEYDFEVKIDGPALLIDEDGDEDDEAEFEDIDVGDDREFKFTLLPNEDEDTGEVTITVTSDGLKAGKAVVKAAVAGEPKAIQLKGDKKATVSNDGSEYAEFEVQLVDKRGVPTANEDLEYSVELKLNGVGWDGGVLWTTDEEDWDDDQVAVGNTIRVTPDEYTGKVKVFLATPYAEKITVSAEDPDGDLKDSAAVDVVFEAADPKYIGFKHKELNFLTEANAENTVVAQLYDEFFNPVAKSGVEATIVVGGAVNGRVEINDKVVDSGDTVKARTNKDGQIVLDVVTARSVDSLTLTIDNAKLQKGLTVADPSKNDASVSGTVALNSKKSVASSIDVVVVDAAGKKTSSVKPGDTINLEITVKDDDRDLFDLIGESDANQKNKYLKITFNSSEVSNSKSAYLAIKEAKRDEVGVYKLSKPITLPDQISLDKLSFKVELLNVEKVLSDTVTVTVKDDRSSYKFEAPSSVTVTAGGNIEIPVTVKSSKVRDLGYNNVKVLLLAYNSKTKQVIEGIKVEGALAGDGVDGTFNLAAKATAVGKLTGSIAQEGKYKIELYLIDADGEEIASSTIMVTVEKAAETSQN